MKLNSHLTKKNYLVVGIGINVNLNSEDFLNEQKKYKINPTSMSIESDCIFEIDKVCSSLLINFCKFLSYVRRKRR